MGCVAGPSASGALALNATGGLTIIGRSFYWYTEHEAGFWFRPPGLTAAIASADSPQTPDVTDIELSYPNPLNPMTKIKFQVAEGVQDRIPTHLEIISITGRRIVVLVDDSLSPGFYEATWDGHNSDGRSVASGVYFARLTAGDYSGSIRLVVMK
jgi:hypothetical protein